MGFGKYVNHLNILSKSSVRIFSTFECPGAADRRTAGSGNVLAAFPSADRIELYIVTNNHVVSETFYDAGLTYKLKTVEILDTVIAVYDQDISLPACTRLHSHQELLDILATDIAFVKCTHLIGVHTDPFTLVPIVPRAFAKPHGSLFGTGYPGLFPSTFEKLFFHTQSRVATYGEYFLSSNHIANHTAPTKKGMSGLAMATFRLPESTFSCIHYGGIGTSLMNGCASVSHPGFACLYGRYIASVAFTSHSDKQAHLFKYLTAINATINTHCPDVHVCHYLL